MTAPPIRVLVAKPGLDGHDRGAKVIATGGLAVLFDGQIFRANEMPRRYLPARMIMTVWQGKVKSRRSLLKTDRTSLPLDRAQTPTGPS